MTGGAAGGAGGGPGLGASDIADVELYRATQRHRDVIRQHAIQLSEDLRHADELISSRAPALARSVREYDRHLGELNKSIEFLGRKSADHIRSLDQHWNDRLREFDRHMVQARRGMGTAGGEYGIGLSGQRGGYRGMQGQISGLMSQLPMGGMLGLALYGSKREQEFEATAHRQLRIFDQIGGSSKKMTASLANDVRNLNELWGSTGEELEAVNAAFARAGISSERAFAATQYKAAQFGNDLKSVVAGLEAAYKLNPGSLAAQIGDIFSAGAADTQPILQSFMSLAGVAEDAKVNVEFLFATLTQGAGSLRLQRQGLDDLTLAFGRVAAAYRKSGRYATPEAAGTAAAEDVRQAAGGLANIPEGLLGYFGQQQGYSGVDAVIKGQEAMLDSRGNYASGWFKRLARLAREVTGNGSRSEQIYALNKIHPSLGFQGARAIVDMGSGKLSETDVKNALDSPQQKLLDAYKKRVQEESDWEKVQRKLLLHMAAVGSGILTTMVGLSGWLVSWVSGDEKARAGATKIMQSGNEAVVDATLATLDATLEGYSDAANPDPGQKTLRTLRDRLAEQQRNRKKAAEAASEQDMAEQRRQRNIAEAAYAGFFASDEDRAAFESTPAGRKHAATVRRILEERARSRSFSADMPVDLAGAHVRSESADDLAAAGIRLDSKTRKIVVDVVVRDAPNDGEPY